jgi:hypothetical protein
MHPNTDIEIQMAIADKLCTRSPEHAQAYDRLKARAGSLWPEVCYSANLKGSMNATQFTTALIHGLGEWDLLTVEENLGTAPRPEPISYDYRDRKNIH